MTLHWVFQRNRRNPFETQRLSQIVEALGFEAHIVELVPFGAEIPQVSAISAGAPVVCYGPGFVPRALTRASWRPGIFFDAASFRWSTFRAPWGRMMLNSSAELYKVRDVRRLLAGGERLFVRPDADNKAFEGGVHDAASFAEALTNSRMPDGAPADDNLAVIVAQPLEIASEYRMFVVDGEIVAASSYRHLQRPDGSAFVPTAAVDLAIAAAALWMPAPVACIDVAVCADGTLGIVEANCLNGARFYDADAVALIGAISSYVQRTYRPI
jgi:hypothetical protein